MTITGHTSTDRMETPVIDYEGSQYKTNFWEGQGRDYEDATERLALKQLLPSQGVRIAEIGAGFGRLASMYLGYEQIILFDYSRTLLQDAAKQWGHDPRFVFVAGNIYTLPLATGILDSLVMVRVMHHLANVPQALQQIQRVMHRHSVAVVEYANKRNFKALLRWVLGKQVWSPIDLAPVEFVKLNFDFHPMWMNRQFNQAKLLVNDQLAVSHFRWPLLKNNLNAEKLAKADHALFRLGGLYPLAPSVFTQLTAPTATARAIVMPEPSALAQLFCCPSCAKEMFEMVGNEQLLCMNCGKRYIQKSGVWDFKDAVLA
ncbi:hypothetical protein BH10CHL1_BH10CHL1_38840 [soil metagenome]